MIYTHKYSVLRWIQIKARDVFVNSNIWQKKINRRWRCDSLISEEDGPCSSYNSTSYPHLSTLQSDRHKRKSWNNPHHLLKSFSGFSPGGNESSLCVWCWGHLKSIMSPCFQCRASDPPSEERDDQHSALQDAIWQQHRDTDVINASTALKTECQNENVIWISHAFACKASVNIKAQNISQMRINELI